MSSQRPINLDLMTVSFPITAIASILHRVCAVITWVGLGFLLVILCYALGSQQAYDNFAELFATNVLLQFFSWGFLSAFAYYCMGTIKHIVQDFGFFESFAGGQIISWAAILSGLVLSVLAGLMVWA